MYNHATESSACGDDVQNTTQLPNLRKRNHIVALLKSLVDELGIPVDDLVMDFELRLPQTCGEALGLGNGGRHAGNVFCWS